MAKKLKNLIITSTDLVDRGANPDAHVQLVKRAGNWCRQLLGKNSELGEEPEPEDGSQDGVEKAETFAEAYSTDREQEALRRLSGEMYDYCYALSDSLCSIICDADLETERRASLMEKSVSEFTAAMSAAIPKWANNKSAEILPAEHVEKQEQEVGFDELWKRYELESDGAGAISDAEGLPGEPERDNITKQQEEERMDKENMTPEDKAALEALEKKYGEQPAQPEAAAEELKDLHPDVAKCLEDLQASQTEKSKEIDELKKRLEISELMAVAKKYEPLGKDTAELAEKLYNYKKSGGTTYTDVVALMDEQLTMQQSTGLFNEIGKSTSGHGGALGRIHGAAAEVAKGDATLTAAQSVVKAFEENPEMLADYDKEYKGGNY